MSSIQSTIFSTCDGFTKSGKKCTYKRKIGNFCKIHNPEKKLNQNDIKEQKLNPAPQINEQKLDPNLIQNLILERDLLTTLLSSYGSYTDITSKILEKIDLLNCKIDSLKFKNIIKNEECEICSIQKQIFVQLICGHYFCSDCTPQILKTTKNRCAKCKRDVETKEMEK
jgi:hypothetical protein